MSIKPNRQKSKYGSRKITKDGITFDSVREYSRYCELKLLERAGKIEKLNRQVPYTLIPAQYRTVIEPKTRSERRVCIERAVTYKADFTYWQDGKFVVEDVKGFKTKEYVIKRKLMLHIYDIQIKEV